MSPTCQHTKICLEVTQRISADRRIMQIQVQKRRTPRQIGCFQIKPEQARYCSAVDVVNTVGDIDRTHPIRLDGAPEALIRNADGITERNLCDAQERKRACNGLGVILRIRGVGRESNKTVLRLGSPGRGLVPPNGTYCFVNSIISSYGGSLVITRYSGP